MERHFYISLVVLILALSLGLGLGLGLKDPKVQAYQVYGRVTKKNTMNEYITTSKSWVYPLYKTKANAEIIYGKGNYHYRMFEGCPDKYYMGNNINQHSYSYKSIKHKVDTCNGQLLGPTQQDDYDYKNYPVI